MAFAWYFLITSYVLVHADDDGTAMLQVMGKVDQRSSATPAVSTPMPQMVPRFLAVLQSLADKQKLNNATELQVGFNATQLRSNPLCLGNPFCLMGETIRITKKGCGLVMDAMHESVNDQQRMSEETDRAVKAYHDRIGQEGLSISSASEQQLDDAKPALLDVMGVFEHGWQRGIDIGKKNAGRVHDFFVNGEGSQVDLIGQIDGLTDLMAPERVDQGTKGYTEGLEKARDALAPEAETVEEKKLQLVQARKALLQLKEDVDVYVEKTLKGERSGQAKFGLGMARVALTSMVGKDFLDKMEESIELSWQIAHKTEEFTDTVAHLIVE